MKHKRLTSLLLALCMLFSVLPISASAADILIYKVGPNGYLGLNRFTGALEKAVNITGDLVIPPTIEGVAVTSIAPATFSGFEELKSITVPSSVKIIGDRAFNGCTRMLKVTVSEGTTTIGKEAFRYCYSLKDISLPSTLKSIESYTFSSCIAMKEINIPTGVKSIGSYAFSGCTSLTNLNMPDGITFIGDYAFSECTGLSTIVLPNGLEAINTALFNNCQILSSVTVPSSVKSVGKSAFGSCTALEFLVLPEGVEKIYDWAFDRCTGLKEITMPDSVSSIAADSFYGCDNMTFRVSAGSYSQVFASANRIPFEIGSGPQPGATPFTDIANHWGKEAIEWSYHKGYFNGTSATKFSPNGFVNRGMFVMVLYRMEGEPATGNPTFSDVSQNAYYAKAVAWASSNGIVGGTGNNKFSPTTNITREQFATMLYRYAVYKKQNVSQKGDLSQFKDSSKISKYAVESMTWAVGKRILAGKGTAMLIPKGNATRAEAATMLKRFVTGK